LRFDEDADHLATRHVSVYGRGSSFQGHTAQGAAQDMQVLTRWRGVLDSGVEGTEGTYRQLFAGDTELACLSGRLFGPGPAPTALQLGWPPQDAHRPGPEFIAPGCLPPVGSFPPYSYPFGRPPPNLK
jgi:hypothetical protein